MKFNQIKHIIPAATLALSLGLSSCVGDLDVQPIDPSTIMEPDVNALFNKCYANLGVVGNGGANGDTDIDSNDGGTTNFIRQVFNANELSTDEAICPWGDEGISAFNFNQWGSTHPMVEMLYYRLYFGITMCNSYIDEQGGYDATMTAEVRFLRALQYYYLMDTFGNIPFLEHVSSGMAPQAKRADVFAFIEKELLECVEDMSEPSVKTDAQKGTGYGRADKAAAWLLLARLYLNAEVYTGEAKWGLAKEYAQKVINSPYGLWTKGTADGKWSAYQMLFMGDNGSNGSSCEAILPVLQDGITTTAWGGTLFLMAGCYEENMKDEDFPACNNTIENWQGNRARPELVGKFFPNGDAPNVTTRAMTVAAGDDRALFWGQDRTLSVDDVSQFKNGFSVTKYNNYYSTGAAAHHSRFPDTDFFLMRYAEALLTYAEADARANGNVVTSEGVRLINELRARAHASERASYSLDDILDEWSREFYFEGRRRIDLIRFGYFGGYDSPYKWQWKGGVKAGVNFDPHYNIYAIPESDLNANSNLVQNPGY